MLINAYHLHFLAVIVAILLPGVGASLGLGIAATGMIEAITRQSGALKPITRIFIYGAVIIESAFIAAFVVAITLAFPSYSKLTLAIGLSELGMAIAVGLCACVVALASGFAISGACKAAARQPFFSQRIQMLAIIILTLTETPVFFALILALLMKNSLTENLAVAEGIKMLCVGLLMGGVAVGPSIGQMLFASEGCLAIGINRQAYAKIFTFAILTEAFIETPVLFAFVMSIFILLKQFWLTPILALAVFFSAALVASLGALGTGTGIGLVAYQSVKKIAARPDGYPQILQTSVLCSIFVETSSIFCFFVAVLILIRAAS